MIPSHITFETDDIIRIHLESGVIKTCVFLVKNGADYTMIDAGLDEGTTKEQLLPALQRLQIPCAAIKTLCLSHAHFDHVGGLSSLLPCIPQAQIFAGQKLTDATAMLYDGLCLASLQAVHVPGHTRDSYGFFDRRTGSLISGDAIQLWGVGDFGVSAECPEEYLPTHEKLLKMPIENIFTSHYYDFLGIRAIGKDAARRYITESMQDFSTFVAFIQSHSQTTQDPVVLAQLFAKEHKDHPKMQPGAIANILQYLPA